MATFTVGTTQEGSPLSCNRLAAEVTVNRYCLIDLFEKAKWSSEAGKFDHSEPGPCRILAAYTLTS